MKLLIILFLLINADEKRHVLLFSNVNGSEIRDKQLDELDKNIEGIKERDIVVKSYISFSENEDIWHKWKVDKNQPFTFILVGKDGSEKYRSNKVVYHQELFGKIDAMPMRKSEIKGQKNL